MADNYTNDPNYRSTSIDNIDGTDAEKVARDQNTGNDAKIGAGLGAVGGAVVGGIAGGPIGAVIGAVAGGIASDAGVAAVDRHDHDGSPGDTGAGSSTGLTDPAPGVNSSAAYDNNRAYDATVDTTTGSYRTGDYDAVVDTDGDIDPVTGRRRLADGTWADDTLDTTTGTTGTSRSNF